jgi:hypothetical protein
MSFRATHFHSWIPDVEEITLEQVHPGDDEPGYQMCISVRTKRGDSFSLLLHARKKENLEFRDPPDLDDEDWQEPSLYIPDEDPPY